MCVSFTESNTRGEIRQRTSKLQQWQCEAHTLSLGKQLEGPEDQSVNKEQDKVKPGEAARLLTSSDLKLLPCMPCFQKASTLSWRHTARGKKSDPSVAYPNQGNVGFSPTVIMGSMWIMKSMVRLQLLTERNSKITVEKLDWNCYLDLMHTLLFTDTTQTFPVCQDKIGISVFKLFSLSLLFSGSSVS